MKKVVQSGNGCYQEESKVEVRNWMKICGKKVDIRDFLPSDPHKTKITNEEDKKYEEE